MVQCLGYRNGTDCNRRVRTTRRAVHWDKYQLCAKCFKNPKTEDYRLARNVIPLKCI